MIKKYFIEIASASYAQPAYGIPSTNDNYTNYTNLIFYIALPIVIVIGLVIFILKRKNAKKNNKNR